MGRWLGTTLLLILLLFSANVQAEEADERHTEVHIVDHLGRTVLVTGLEVVPGDSFIDSGNMLWNVIGRSGGRAEARATGLVSLALTEREAAALPPVVNRAGMAGDADIGIFHTHNAEAYEPTDGLRWIAPEGSITRVGRHLARAFERQGRKAIHIDTNHLPHDRLAYARSRRTLVKMMAAHSPAVLIDVHRDTAGLRAYETHIDGKRAGRLMLVVGRANPSMEASLAFAKLVKAQMDEDRPGHMRAIYFGKGHYNQDLFPRLLLVEAGTFELTAEEAERGVALLAASVDKVLDMQKGRLQGPGDAVENRAAWRSIASWLLAALLFGTVFFVLSNGGWPQARQKLHRLLGGDREEDGR